MCGPGDWHHNRTIGSCGMMNTGILLLTRIRVAASISIAGNRKRSPVRLFCCFITFCLFISASSLYASDGPLEFGRIAAIDLLMDLAISKNLIAGGVVVIGNHNGILSSTSRGRLSDRPDAPLLDQQTIFDLASLTKVIATTPAIMKLLDEGKITLLDTLGHWFPEFKGLEHENVTIINLLTHTSGLTDFEMSTDNVMKTAIERAAAEKNQLQPGDSFRYADINFILLGELVHRASGKTLDVYCREELFKPLLTPETMFLPPPDLADRIAPTLGVDSGTVQDRNSRRLGSVAGHAGLFSSAQDLARFARLMLDGGTLDGREILSERAVKLMTSPFLCRHGTVERGLGWDIDSPYSAPKGKLFSEASFGHTGYSGSSIWIDPKQDLFVIMLTNRLNYRSIRQFNQLRSDISTIAVAEFRKPGDNIPVDSQRVTAVQKSTLRIAHVQQRAHRKVSAASRGIRLATAEYELRSVTHHQYSKKRAKSQRHKSYGRSRRV
ncbi:MAG: serine hydrolase [Desulfuromonadaceae bacterium]|nr:serine hydrolase [Desulfuromonadaceae bacterium]